MFPLQSVPFHPSPHTTLSPIFLPLCSPLSSEIVLFAQKNNKKYGKFKNSLELLDCPTMQQCNEQKVTELFLIYILLQQFGCKCEIKLFGFSENGELYMTW
jgi:hypothetical protein